MPESGVSESPPPSGGEAKREKAAYRVAVHVLVRAGEAILLLQRANTGYADGMWTTPAGHVEFGETCREAASRELREEVGLEVPPSAIKLLLVQHKQDPVDGQERMDLFFEIVHVQGTPKNNEPDKCSGIGWFTPGDELKLVGYVRNAIDSILKGEVYAEYGWGTCVSTCGD